MLSMLKRRKIPVVEIRGLTTHGGRPAVVMKLYGEGSKQTVTNDEQNFNRPIRVGNSAYLNARSIKDLQDILRKCQQQKVSVDDIQFLIGTDGFVVIADPLTVQVGKGDPSSNVMQMILRLMEAAGENELYDLLQNNQGKSYSEDDLKGALMRVGLADQYTQRKVLEGFKTNFGSTIKWDEAKKAFRYSGFAEPD